MKYPTQPHVGSLFFRIAAILLVATGTLLAAGEQTLSITDTEAPPPGQPTRIQLRLLQEVSPKATHVLQAGNAQVGYRGGDNRLWISADLTAIPPKSFIVSAVLKMYQVSKIGMPQNHRLDLCLIRKHVDPEHLSWFGPVQGIAWTQAGANADTGETADRTPPLATERVSPREFGIQRQWDCTQALQTAMDEGAFNGFLLFDRDINPKDPNSGLTMFGLPTDLVPSRRPVLEVKFTDTPVDRTPENSLLVPEKPPEPIRGFQCYREGELPYDGYALTKFAMISSGAPWSNFSASAGRGTLGLQPNGVETRVLIRFDGLKTTPHILAKATLDIVCEPGERQPEIQLCRVTQPWHIANVSWQEFAYHQPWKSVGGDTEEIRLPTAVTQQNGLHHIRFDLTPWLDAWLKNPATNFGMQLRFPAGQAQICLPESDNNGRRPMLTLEFGPKATIPTVE